MKLPVNIEDILSAHNIENNRIEFKEGWNPDAIYRTIAAFANDFDNTGGGYIIIGVSEDQESATASRPIKGLSKKEISIIQKEMIGFNNLLRPYYAPKLYIEEVDNKDIVILWVPAGNDRPYEVPENITSKNKVWKFFIRKYASTIEAKASEKEELISLAGNIPFDDRVNTHATVSDISSFLVTDYLRIINSKLYSDAAKRNFIDLLQQLDLLRGPGEFLHPVNVALMLFSEKPHHFFPYTWIELIHFPKGPGGKEFSEKKFEGPVHKQITDVLTWIKSNFLYEKVKKVEGQAASLRIWNYPFEAIEETVANCIFHRNYQVREPVKIRIEPDAIILYNSGGPDRALKKEDFINGKIIPKRYRNRRLGDFLKRLELTEGHATGIPLIIDVMKNNGSPSPLFDFDDERSWFQVILPIHPTFRTKIAFKTNIIEGITDVAKMNDLLNKLIDHAEISLTETFDGGIDEGIALRTQSLDIQAKEIVKYFERGIAKGIADRIENDINPKMLHILKIAREPQSRKDIMNKINLVNNANNFENYIQFLVLHNWLAKTIPDKPTSPLQKYYTTIKGRIINEICGLK
ncbi:MAG: putative DNA binding domain-containing protein [Bacteroidales bacterium]|nr:putative DNA binding domain-containing protein [Bacteroidales bacterium]